VHVRQDNVAKFVRQSTPPPIPVVLQSLYFSRTNGIYVLQAIVDSLGGSPSTGVALDCAPARSLDNSVEPLKLRLGRASEGSDKAPSSRTPGTRVSRRQRLPWLVRLTEVE